MYDIKGLFNVVFAEYLPLHGLHVSPASPRAGLYHTACMHVPHSLQAYIIPHTHTRAAFRVICPWALYEQYADVRTLARCLPAMTAFVDYNLGRCQQPGWRPPATFHCFGDWLNVEDDTPKVVREIQCAGV